MKFRYLSVRCFTSLSMTRLFRGLLLVRHVIKPFQRRLGRRLRRRLLAGPLPSPQPNIAGQHLDRIFAPWILALLGDDMVARREIALGLDALLKLAFVIQYQATRLNRRDMLLE